MDRLHTMGELDRMAQRDLQHRGAELDPRGGNAQRTEGDERVERRPAPPERVGHPDPWKAAPFNLPCVLDDAVERPAARLTLRSHKGHNTQSHNHSPGADFAVTKSSLSSLADCSGEDAT